MHCTCPPKTGCELLKLLRIVKVNTGVESERSLSRQGYNVRGTVRSKSATDKVGHLLKLAEAFPGTLTLYEADLLKEGSFDEVHQPLIRD